MTQTCCSCLIYLPFYRIALVLQGGGALPPGFAPVRINGELYWDGGLYPTRRWKPSSATSRVKIRYV